MDYSHIKKPDLGYPYEFSLDELDAAQACVEAHGFAIVKDVLPTALVEELQASVKEVLDPDGALGEGNSFTHTSFIEHSPTMWKMLDHEPFMKAQRVFSQAEELTINRSAAILRNPGSDPLRWHSDWRGFSRRPPIDAGDVLNRGPWPSGLWFYITGSHPTHGGLAVIEDSHVEDWEGPEGFQLTPDRGSFHPVGTEPHGHIGFDVPGLVPLFTDPCDEIVFADRTYHSAFPNRVDRVRLSCGVGFRPRGYPLNAPWPLSETARAFIKAIPEHLKPMVEEYVGIDTSWRGDGSAG
ncbi:MAG: phytanoyl-CoA dioxygenase family protein [Caldilineaceae bacterium]|nr:phytanoyl-CoA dioxygenase family protein [Caldilineaceae bacterium]MCY4090180.1 phytanoyl-CoA dioxygenase family protein [Caldilineaceae bacterium]MCY4117945.1 phytanoyl-CoA dioxygenase family protein [Caldilineaceae bacterium]